MSSQEPATRQCKFIHLKSAGNVVYSRLSLNYEVFFWLGIEVLVFALLHRTAHFTFIFIPGRFREKGNFYMETTGYIHSIDSFGSVDGPGVRFVTFLQGCHMRCRYCHNPDTWKLANAAAVSEQQISGNAAEAHANTVQNTASDSAAPSSVCNYKEMTPSALIRQALRYKRYWGKEGGITVSGGEPLLQIDFMNELFRLAKENGVGTVLDTAGQPFTREDPFFSKLTDLMENTDLVMLDLKHIDPEKHRALTGHTNENILAFARYLNEIGKPMWIRHVLVPGVTDDNENLHGIRAFLDTLSNVKKVEVLPYHTLGIYKWESLGIPYTLKDVDPPTAETVKRAEEILGC